MIGGLPCLALLAAVLAAIPSASPAQTRFDYRYSRDEADREMEDFSKCLVAHRSLRAEAERYLRQIPGNKAFHDAGVHLATPDCLPHGFSVVRMRFKPDLLRASLFNALYQRDFGHLPPPADFKAVPPLILAGEFDGLETDIPQPIVITRMLGDCVARADPAAVHALVVTGMAGKDERDALTRVVPLLAGCLPAGQKIGFSRTILRGALAEALYKLRKVELAPPLVQASKH